jgi:hypothetical protein
MHAKASKVGLRFFAHDHANDDCHLNGETPQHRYLKSVLAQIIRSHVGWVATLEAAPTDRDHGGWRADVLATAPGGRRRIAFEVQLASMPASVGVERTRLYKQDGIEAIWLSDLRLPSWLGHVPAVVLNHKRGQLSAIPAENLRVAYGVVAWEGGELVWLEEDFPRHKAPLLSDVIVGLLDKQYKPRQLHGVTVLASSGRALCTQRAFLETVCRKAIMAEPCPLHGSPPAMRTLRRAAGLAAWGWDEGRFWKDAQKDADSRRLAPRNW